MALHIVDHPLAAHLLVTLRDKNTGHDAFRRNTRSLTVLIAIEATRAMESLNVEVATPLETTQGRRLAKSLAIVPVLRAGLGMLDPIVELFHDVSVGYIGLERSDETAQARSYYCKLPRLDGRYCLCVDPMLATGGSACQAVGFMKAQGAHKIAMVCVVAAPQGVRRLQEEHPDVEIFTAALDRDLNHKSYILPGLGDFGDRLYGTM